MCKERYINPFTDFSFKKLFGSKGSEQSLISILNAVIDDGDPITSITYLPTEKLGMTQHSRVAIYDLYCRTQSGSHIIVEMQNNGQDFFVDRSIYYSSFPIQEAARKGQWDYSLPKIYTVSFLNFNIHDFESGDSARNVVKLANVDTGEVFYDKLTYIYIELPKFNKGISELETQFDWWLYILKYMDQLDEPPKELVDDVMRYFFDCADIKRFNEKQIRAYEDSLKAMRDYVNIIESAKRKSEREGMEIGIAKGIAQGMAQGMAKGLEEGMAKGLEEGRAEGLEEGRAEGKDEARKESIRIMLSLGISPESIASKYGITVEEVTSVNDQ